MNRRLVASILLAVLSLVGLLGYIVACTAQQQSAVGDAVVRYERARVLSVDDEELIAEVRILEPLDDVTVGWGTFAEGEEGQASFSGWEAGELPEVGADIVLKWIGSPDEKSSFPIGVYDWESTVDFCASLGEVHEVRLTASMLTFMNQTADDLVADFADTPDLALEARMDGDDLVLVFTSGQLEDYRADIEDSLNDYATSLRESDEVASLKIADDHTGMTIAIAPALLDKPVLTGKAFMGVPGMCITLQALDGVTDWQFDVTVIDAETDEEIGHATLPEESLTIG